MIGVRIGAMTVGTGAMIAETDARRTTDPLRWFDSLRALAADAGFLGRARVNASEAGFGPRSHLETTVNCARFEGPVNHMPTLRDVVGRARVTHDRGVRQ
jgi:hypothetical protein